MSQPYMPGTFPPVVVAENTRTAEQPAGPCGGCQYATWPGDRIADLPGRRGVVHIGCATASQPTERPA